MNSRHSKVIEPAPRDYPLVCVECGRREVYPEVVRETVRRNHDGRIYELAIDDLPVTRCRACGETFYSLASDDRIVTSLRETLGLLTPDQIRASLKTLHLTQREAAKSLGVAAETLSRWLAGGLVQSRAMDNLLRAYFASPDVRRGLQSAKARSRFGVRVQLA